MIYLYAPKRSSVTRHITTSCHVKTPYCFRPATYTCRVCVCVCVCYSSRDDSRLAAFRDVRPETLRFQGPLFVSAGQRFRRTRVLAGAELPVGNQRPLYAVVPAGFRDDFDRSSAQGERPRDVRGLKHSRLCRRKNFRVICGFFFSYEHDSESKHLRGSFTFVPKGPMKYLKYDLSISDSKQRVHFFQKQ